MTLDSVHAIVSRSIMLIIICSGPIVGVGLIVGFTISVFQAVTQIQEQTLTFVPKMLVVLLLIAFTFPWMGSMIVNFAQDLWISLPMISK